MYILYMYILYIYIYIYMYVYINFVCHIPMSKYICIKPRNLFIKKFYFSFFQTFKDSIYMCFFYKNILISEY